jgi:hypothetical protein
MLDLPDHKVVELGKMCLSRFSPYTDPPSVGDSCSMRYMPGFWVVMFPIGDEMSEEGGC